MKVENIVDGFLDGAALVRDATRVKNPRIWKTLLGPAWRGLVQRRGKKHSNVDMPTAYKAHFDWKYERDEPELAKLYTAAKQSQWDADSLDWTTTVDPHGPVMLMNRHISPLNGLPQYDRLPKREKDIQDHAMLAWMLSQFLHGEQGALFAACQLTEAYRDTDGKLYGSTQVVDEGRHVEVFHRYVYEKLEKLYEINDNLYVLIDALMSDDRWDIKFLSMQIMIEGLALGAFGTLRQNTEEPLLRELLKNVITDEARHVHFGVVALRDYYLNHLSERERRDREDWAFETSVLMRNRFLAHEFYDEYYGHVMRRSAWNRLMLGSDFMQNFRVNMFRRIVPNLRRIGLLTERVRPYYQQLGLLVWEDGKAAPDLTAADLLAA